MALEATGLAVENGPVKGPQGLVSGIALVLLALLALYLTRDLSQGTLRSMGPAMLPRWLAIGVGMCGVALIVGAFLQVGSALETYTLRGPGMVVLGVLAFGATIRGVQIGPFDIPRLGMIPSISVPQLGMIVAGPLAMFIGGFATSEVRWRELMILALALTAFCMVLFGDLLNLPIPLYPQAMSDLYPAGWSNDARLRFTAGLLVVLAVAIYFLSPEHREPEPVDVVPNEHAGTV